jgi:hypothetical protein
MMHRTQLHRREATETEEQRPQQPMVPAQLGFRLVLAAAARYAMFCIVLGMRMSRGDPLIA